MASKRIADLTPAVSVLTTDIIEVSDPAASGSRRAPMSMLPFTPKDVLTIVDAPQYDGVIIGGHTSTITLGGTCNPLDGAVALGNNININLNGASNGERFVVIGHDITFSSTDDDSGMVIIGSNCSAVNCGEGVVIGLGSSIDQTAAVAIRGVTIGGTVAIAGTANGGGAVSIAGSVNSADSVGYGGNVQPSCPSSTAIGVGADCKHARTTLIGAGVVSTAPDQTVIGSLRPTGHGLDHALCIQAFDAGGVRRTGTVATFDPDALTMTLAQSADMLSTLLFSSVSITGATTLTSTAFGRWHVCSGTSSDYTVVLPAASGNAGKIIGIRMAVGLTRLVTIDGDGSELIDGQITRVMWSGETAILICDGTGWTKIAGKSRQMLCVMRLANASPGTAQSLPNAVVTKVLLNQADIDNTGLIANVANNRMIARRAGVYTTTVLNYLTATSPISRVIAQCYKNGAQVFAAEEATHIANSYPTPTITSLLNLAAGDTVELFAYQDSGSSAFLYGDATGATCFLAIQELVSW